MIALPSQALDLTGHVYGRLTVVEPVGQKHRSIVWRCQCECGNIAETIASSLRNGNTKSCGCAMKSHGHSGQKPSPEYRVWSGMKSRCLDTDNPAYGRYGGRGITICDRWIESFEAFLSDMGPRPKGTTLERKNNHAGYGPGNCIWATATQQGRNKRNNRLLTFRGRTQCVAAWAEELGLSYAVLHARTRLGWSAERSLTTPVKGLTG